MFATLDDERFEKMQDRAFQSMKTAALALKDLDQWSVVRNRSDFYFDIAVMNDLVWEGDVHGKHEFPFCWMFPKRGLQKRSRQGMCELQLALTIEMKSCLKELTTATPVVEDTSRLPPRKRYRDAIPTPKLMMKFSRSKVERMTSEEEENTAIFV